MLLEHIQKNDRKKDSHKQKHYLKLSEINSEIAQNKYLKVTVK